MRDKVMFLSIRVNKQEKLQVQELACRFGYSISDYIKRKIFNENVDIDSNGTRYMIPSREKNNLLTVTMLCKMLYLQLEILEKLGCTAEEISLLEKKSLEYARSQREKQGYRIINRENVGNLSDG
jgi:hypothetical protein